MLSRTIPESVHRLTQIGISEADAFQLRRIAMTLHRWHELECGTDAGHIERDEATGKTYWCDTVPERHAGARVSWVSRCQLIADREAGAKRRLARILKSYPHLTAYVQTDPRGAALYILRAGDVPEGADVSSYYSRGVAVYK